MAAPAPEFSVGATDQGLRSIEAIDLAPSRLRVFAKSLELWVPAGFLVLMILACFVWPEIYPVPNPVRGDLSTILVPPLSPHHLFGTDQLGNDVFSRILYGGQISLETGFGTSILGFLVGGSLGMIAAFKGGVTEIVVMRILEVFLALPSLVLAIVVTTYLGPSELHVIWAISFFTVPAFARIARASTLRLRDETFIVASKLSGTKDWRIMVRHVLPNILPPLMTFALLGIGIAILAEAALSFLGLGIRLPEASWGNMIAGGQTLMTTYPDLLLIPSAFLFATVVSVNMLGDALRERWGVQ